MNFMDTARYVYPLVLLKSKVSQDWRVHLVQTIRRKMKKMKTRIKYEQWIMRDIEESTVCAWNWHFALREKNLF